MASDHSHSFLLSRHSTPISSQRISDFFYRTVTFVNKRELLFLVFFLNLNKRFNLYNYIIFIFNSILRKVMVIILIIFT